MSKVGFLNKMGGLVEGPRVKFLYKSGFLGKFIRKKVKIIRFRKPRSKSSGFVCLTIV